jgi:hypothetical protein
MSKEKSPPEGYKVLTFQIEMRHPEETLTKEEVNEAIAAILKEMEKKGAYAVSTEVKQEWRETQDEWYSKKDKI